MSKWQGTPVPNTGYVENVYFNTELSIEEVVNLIISTDEFSQNNSYVFIGDNETCIIVAFNDGAYKIANEVNGDIYFDSSNNGWQNISTINFNATTISDYGLENDKLSTLFSTTPFVEVQEKVTLNSFLTSIADAIRSKKGTTEKINASNFASEIASISGGSGVGAVIKTEGNLIGTPISLTGGYLENVYFNINIEPTEVIKIIDDSVLAILGANLETIGNIGFLFLSNEEQTTQIGFVYESGIYMLMGGLDGTESYLFVYSHNDSIKSNIESEVGFIGWNPELQNTNGVLATNVNAIDLTVEYEDSITMAQNFIDSMSSFLSSKPFVKSGGEEVNLSGEYDGTPITIEKLKGGWQGTAVPESGLVDKVYFNTNLSFDEVVEIAKNLNYLFFEGLYVSVCFTDVAMQKVIIIMKIPASEIGTTEDAYVLQCAFDRENPYYFQTFDVDNLGWIGWNPNITGVIDVNMENMVTDMGSQIGYIPENNKLSKILSSTPFVEKKANVLYLKDYIENQQIPLEINVKVRSGNAVITTPKYIGTQVPNSGTVENVYFNTELSVEETNNIITNAGFTVNQTYPILTKSDKSNAIVIMNNSSGQYAILDAAFTAIYFHSFPENEADFGFIGWNPNITMPIAINSEVISELNGTPSGDLNNLITSLFSTTPFEVENEKLAELGGEYASTDIEITEDGIIDVLEIIDNQEAIPTKIITTSTKNFILGDIPEYNDMYFLKEARVGLFAESNITNANLPYLEEIPQYMFYGCKELTTINCPKAEYIGKCAFYECKQLTSIDFPEASRIGNHAFYQTGIKNFNLPKVYEIDDYAFSWTPIEHFESSEVSNIGPYSFTVCYNLISVKLPKVTELRESAFEGCSVLKSVDLPAVTRIYGSAFQMCYELNNVKFPNLTELIGNRIFASCKALTDLYFGKYVSIPGNDTILTLPGHTVTIHVRSEHLEQYEAVGTSWHYLTVTGRVVIVGDYTD